ncbi:MAG: hypothetical protein KF746_22360 [Chitinophagaceae bacterium]|nr:hypothetical protein [Chitinophagaceae bacterium]
MNIIYLTAIDKMRIVFFTPDTTEFIGILTPYLRKMRKDNSGLFMLADDPSERTFRYVVNEEGEEFITNDRGGSIPLSKGRSLTGVIADKLSNNNFTRSINEAKKRYNDLFDSNGL